MRHGDTSTRTDFGHAIERDVRAGGTVLKTVFGIAFGCAALVAVIAFNYDDLVGIGAVFRQAPLGLAISMAVHVPQIVLTALAWRILLPPRGRPRVVTMIVLRWIRESLNALVPAGAIIGQAIATKRLIGIGVPSDVAGATATVDMTIEAATQAIFTLFGLGLLLLLNPDFTVARLALIGIAVAIGTTAAALIAQRNLPVRFIERACTGLLGRWIAMRDGWLADFQRSVLRLHADRSLLLRAACCHLTAWAIGSIEIAGIATLLGHPISIAEGSIVESLTQALRSAAFMVPGALGLQEGVIIAACGLVGVPPNAALVLALLRRAREILIGVPGLIVWRRLGPSAKVAESMWQAAACATVSSPKTDQI